MSHAAMRWVITALLAGSTTGCAILAPSEGHGGGSSTLGDAVRAAAPDSSHKVQRLDAGRSTPPAQQLGSTAESESLQPNSSTTSLLPGTAATEQPKRAKRWSPIGVMFGGGALGGSAYDGLGTFGLSLGSSDPGRWRGHLLATLNTVNFAGESKLGRAFQKAKELELDLAVRYYLTPSHTFVGVYGMAGLGTGTLFWNYANPVPVIQDGVATTVSDDHINHFDCFAGAGTTLMQFRHVELGGNAVAGVRLYGWHTSSGFANDELPTTGFVRGVLNLEFR